MSDIEYAKNLAYEAWNQTDHADKLVRCARADLDAGDVAEALANLRAAMRPAESSAMRIRWAIEQLEKVQT